MPDDNIQLNIIDEFIVTDIGIYLQATETDTVSARNDKFLLTAPPLNLSLAQSAVVQPLYRGQLKIAVNNIVYLEKWDVMKHSKTTQTQFQPNVAANPALSPNIDFSEDSMFELAPMLTLSGAKKNDITIQLPKAMTVPTAIAFTDGLAAAGTITINKIAIRLFGLNAQNAARFQ